MRNLWILKASLRLNWIEARNSEAQFYLVQFEILFAQNCHCRTCCGNPSFNRQNPTGELHSNSTMDYRNKSGNDISVREVIATYIHFP
jgi:hypothetical protein